MQSKVGGGLPPMWACQLTHVLLTGRHRGQAPSHSLSRFFQLMLGKLFELACRELCGSASYYPAQAMQSKVGGGLPPMWECQLTHVLLTGRHRGQAPSHTLSRFFQLMLGKPFGLACRERCGSAPYDPAQAMQSKVGGGLPPMWECGSAPYDPAQAMQSKVGGGLPPMWECQLMHVLLTRRHRGQAPSHMLCGFFQ
ncbi:hypothetical protein AO259_10975 [Pseudomonas sp. ICMP 564]|nr:hypothetical protein AO259_10975 [Pseudomonas sp. ICMP 564]